MTGEELKELRKSLGLTQLQLAKMACLSGSEVIANYENEGKRNRKISKPMAMLFEKILNTPQSYFLCVQLDERRDLYEIEFDKVSKGRVYTSNSPYVKIIEIRFGIEGEESLAELFELKKYYEQLNELKEVPVIAKESYDYNNTFEFNLFQKADWDKDVEDIKNCLSFWINKWLNV